MPARPFSTATSSPPPSRSQDVGELLVIGAVVGPVDLLLGLPVVGRQVVFVAQLPMGDLGEGDDDVADLAGPVAVRPDAAGDFAVDDLGRLDRLLEHGQALGARVRVGADDLGIVGPAGVSAVLALGPQQPVVAEGIFAEPDDARLAEGDEDDLARRCGRSARRARRASAARSGPCRPEGGPGSSARCARCRRTGSAWRRAYRARTARPSAATLTLAELSTAIGRSN